MVDDSSVYSLQWYRRQGLVPCRSFVVRFFRDCDVSASLFEFEDRSWVDLRGMLRRVVDIGALLEGAVALGSSVPSHSPPVDTAQSISKGLEMLIQCSLAQPASVVVPQPIPTAIPASATASSGSGKPSLKLPYPSVFEGDPMKLDPWLMQTEMCLGTYDVGLASARWRWLRRSSVGLVDWAV
eukprot:jgi/Botrbrau1/20916/Bobra.0135s0047.1